MSLKVEYKTLSQTDYLNEYVTLTGVPTDGTVAFDVISGTAQAQGVDFNVIDSSVVTWNGYNLASDMTTSDEIRIIYDKS